MIRILNNIKRLNLGRLYFGKSLTSFIINVSFLDDSYIIQLINLFNFCGVLLSAVSFYFKNDYPVGLHYLCFSSPCFFAKKENIVKKINHILLINR